jgi:hypothetical protein
MPYRGQYLPLSASPVKAKKPQSGCNVANINHIVPNNVRKQAPLLSFWRPLLGKLLNDFNDLTYCYNVMAFLAYPPFPRLSAHAKQKAMVAVYPKNDITL